MAKKALSINQRLCGAAQDGDLAGVSKLLADGADPNATDKEFGTPLCAAARQGHLEVVQTLIQKGADTNATFSDFGTPLYNAARQGHLDTVKLLLENGADVNGRGGPAFHTPLCYAVSGEHTEIVRYLLDHGADVRYAGYDASTPLTDAVSGGRVEISRMLVERGASLVNGRGEPLTKYIRKAMQNRDAMIQFLKEQGVDVSGLKERHVSTSTGPGLASPERSQPPSMKPGRQV